MTKMPKMKKATATQLTTQRYILTGAALGLYFGLFFRMPREPSLWVVIIWAAVVTIVLTIIRLVRGQRPSAAALLKEMALDFLRYGLVLAVLEGRHLAYAWGGKTVVTIFTTSAGALFGWWYASSQPDQAIKNKS